MPNGYDKNWVRACAAIEGFRVRFGAWPTKLILERFIAEDLRGLFTKKSLSIMQEKISIISVDEVTVRAEDDQGRSYDYANSGFSRDKPDIEAEEWLGVHPDCEYD